MKCNLCGRDDAKEFAIDYSGSETVLHNRRVQCRECGLVYSNPQATTENLKDFYSKTYPNVEAACSAEYGIKEIVSMRHFFTDLNLRIPSRGRFLDIGSANGYLLAVAQEFGWEPYGLELSQVFATFAKEQLGMSNVFIGELQEANFEDRFFDCIHMWHVLEHVSDPLGTLREIYRILKDEGFFCLGVPNIGEPYKIIGRTVARLKGNIPAISTGDFHTYDFTPTTLNQMLNKAGFKVKELAIYYRPLGDTYYYGPITHRALKVFLYYLGRLLPNRFGNFMGIYAVKKSM